MKEPTSETVDSMEELKGQIAELNERLSNMGSFIIKQGKKADTAGEKLSSEINFTSSLLESVAARFKNEEYEPFYNQSEKIDELSAAMSEVLKVTGDIDPTGKANRNEYLTIKDMREATNVPMAENGLSLEFWPFTNKYGEYMLKAHLSHSSGQWKQTAILIHPDQVGNNIADFHQKILSAEKYMRRHLMRSILNLDNGKQ